MKQEQFVSLRDKLVEMGYEHEINWQRNLRPCEDYQTFFLETVWVILNSGMKEQIARIIFDRIEEAWANLQPTSSAFNHKGKVAAIDFVRENCRGLWDNYLIADDKIEYLKTIPYIGNITCFHLAKNLGHDCIKPDRHIQRIADHYQTTPDGLCEVLGKATGERKCVVDIILWRACNVGLINTQTMIISC